MSNSLTINGGTVNAVGNGANGYGLSGDTSTNSLNFSNAVITAKGNARAINGGNSTDPASISGTNAIGQTLTASLTDSNATGTRHYQWYAGGVTVGSDQNTYTIAGSDAGKTITCIISTSDQLGDKTATLAGGVVPYNIVVTNSGNVTGDTVVTLSAATGRVNDTITLNYGLGNNSGTATNTLTFNGGTGLTNLLAASATDTSRIYTVNASDAVDGVITITATFLHSDLAPRTLAFAEYAQTAVFGASDFTITPTVTNGDFDEDAITYSSSNPAIATVDNSGLVSIVAAGGSTTITATIAEGNTYIGTTASYTVTVNNAEQAAPTVGKTDETAAGANDGTITGVDSTMEYKLSDDTSYTTISGTTVTNLAPGTYLVRYAAKTNYNAGADATVTIAAYVAPAPPVDPPVEPTPAPSAPDATVVTDDGKTVSAGEVTVNDKTVEVVVNQDTIKEEISEAEDNVKIIVPAVEGTDTVEVGFVVQNLTDMNEKDVTLTVETPVATLTFNGGAQQAIAASGEASDPVVISVSTVDKADLSEVLSNAVPDDAVIVDFTVTVGGKTVSDFNGGSVAVSVPYTLPTGVNSTQIVVYYLNDNGNLELVVGTYNPATGTVEMTLRHFSRYIIKVNDVKYKVGKGWYNAESLDFAVQRGLVAVVDGIVEPTGETSRADFVISALKALGVQPLKTFKVKQFSDVSHLSAEQQSYLRTARELGVIAGTGGSEFDPDSPALREHFFQIVSNIYKAKLVAIPEITSKKTIADFADGANVPAWAIAATNELISRGVVQGDGSRLQIGTAFNNATTAVMLAKLGGGFHELPDEVVPEKTAVLGAEPRKHDGEDE
ncbi:hypothetical protein FACS1894202_08570 [Clostridia bacterium]|nr:hypothetical protein FACS1894202_08570 [Clostridia bacterium]